MDLRRRLFGYLGALLGALLLMAALITLHSLRHDMAPEVSASAPAPTIWPALLRHTEATGESGQVIQLGEQTLSTAANPNSEIAERLGDTVRLCITLLLYSGATLLISGCSADRALAPVREREQGLHRLAHGEKNAGLPAFARRESRRAASAIDNLAAPLATFRAAQRQLSRQAIKVQGAGRLMLARELHDAIGQTLSAIRVTAAFHERNAGQINAKQIAGCAPDLRRGIRSSGERLRTLHKGLRPHGLVDMNRAMGA